MIQVSDFNVRNSNAIDIIAFELSAAGDFRDGGLAQIELLAGD